MPIFRLSDSVNIEFSDHDFSDPWSDSETILMLHGNAESHEVWFSWIPHLARRFRVICPGMRGFGALTPMPTDHCWSLDELVEDAVRLMDHLGSYHVAASHGDECAKLVLSLIDKYS
jgi:pimeloyl-ACP methyl ester carboxylesterase